MKTFKLIYFLVLIYFINIPLHAQYANFGFGMQVSTYKLNNIAESENRITLPNFSGFHLALEYLPIEKLGIEFRMGYEWEVNHSSVRGFEYSALARYRFISSAYLIGIYTIHNNLKSPGHGGQHITYYMPGFGVGYNLIKQICFELTYHGVKDVIVDRDFFGNETKKLNWLIRLNVGFYLPL